MLRRAWVVVAALALGATACGKKGPPLPPIVRIPAAVTTISAQRVGDDVFVIATLPERNIDGSQPVATVGVEVWAVTGRTPPPRQKWAELGTRIGRVDVAPAAVGVSTDRAADTSLPLQISVHDHLDSAAMTAASEPQTGPASVPLRRFYVAIPLGAKEKSGPVGTVADVDLTSRPGPPADLDVTYDASVLTLTWAPPSDGDAWLAAQRAASRAIAVAPVALDASPWRSTVSRSGETPATPAPAAVVRVAGTVRPAPVNAAPLAKTTFTMPVVFGVETCVTVRSVFSGDGRVAEGGPAPEHCVTPADTFPPAAPKQLAALPSADAIDLIWEANDEQDLAGYHVLRADRSGAPLQRLTAEPVTVTRYRDAAVKPGVKYFYAVVAIDNRTPEPNVSEESNHVEEEPR